MKFSILDKNGNSKIVNLNRRRAIWERCMNCSAWSFKEVRNCSFKECQLFPFRTGKGKQDANARSKSIRDYCLRFCMNEQSGEVSKCPSRDCPIFPYRKSQIDRSSEIQSLAIKGHIRGQSGTKI